MQNGMIAVGAEFPQARGIFVLEESSPAAMLGVRIHCSWYRLLYGLSSTNKVFILSKLRNRSNGRVRERKERGRAH